MSQKPILTVMFTRRHPHIYVSGVCEDADVFRDHVVGLSIREALRELDRQYSRTHRVIVNFDRNLGAQA